MADKISENAGLESGKVTPEQLVKAIELVGKFAKENPEAAVKLVKESLAANAIFPGTNPASNSGKGGNSIPTVSGSGTANI